MLMYYRRHVLLVHDANVLFIRCLYRSRAELPSPITGNVRHATMGE